MDVGARPAEDGTFDVTVTVERLEPGGGLLLNKRAPCFIAPDDLELSVDGHQLRRIHRGKPMTHVSQFSGVRFESEGCQPVLFEGQGLPLKIQPTTQVTAKLGGEVALVELDALLHPRGIRALGDANVRPGDRIEVEWSPSTDLWRGYDASTEFSLYWPDDFSTWIPRAQIEIDAPRFSFTLPELRPGEAILALRGVYLEAHSEIDRCDFGRCTVQGHTGAPEIVLNVLP